MTVLSVTLPYLPPLIELIFVCLKIWNPSVPTEGFVCGQLCQHHVDILAHLFDAAHTWGPESHLNSLCNWSKSWSVFCLDYCLKTYCVNKHKFINNVLHLSQRIVICFFLDVSFSQLLLFSAHHSLLPYCCLPYFKLHRPGCSILAAFSSSALSSSGSSWTCGRTLSTYHEYSSTWNK